MAYHYVVTAHKPTNVTHSVVGNFTGPDENNLIIAKCTRLEVHRLTLEGLSPVLDTAIYGRISILELFRPPNENQDLLFIVTERYKTCLLAYDPKTKEIVTRASGDVMDRIGRPTDSGHIGLVDPDKRVICLHLYDGLLKVIPIDPKGNLKEAYNIRLEELHVVDIKFLHGCPGRPTICVLYQDTKEARHLKTYEINLKEKDFSDGPWRQPNVESGTSLVIPIPSPFGGVVIVGEQTITYLDGTHQHSRSISMKPTQVKAWGMVDPDGSRILLGDHNGSMCVLVLQHDDSKVADIKLELLGETSIPSTITYLDNGVVFVGSSFGDSQLVKLNSDKDQYGSHVEVLETYTNLGPISDFCVVDLERQGQGQVVTCSGAMKDGSLRVVRNGIGINELSAAEQPGIKGMWSLRASSGAVHDTYLVQAFIGDTRVLGLTGEELSEAEIPGFASDEATLYCGNVEPDMWLQATGSSVRLIACASQQVVNQWTPPPGLKINVAAANATQAVVATGGGNLVYFEIEGGKLVEKKHVKLEHEIACVNVNPLGDSEARAPFVAVGMWTDHTLRVYSLPDLALRAKEPLGGETLPRSVLFAAFEGAPYLLCALGDGHLFNFLLDPATGQLSERKKVSLGTQPILLSTFRSKSTTHVFAASDRPTVIYSSNRKLLYSNVNLKEVTHMCAFNSEAFPECLAVASEAGFSIGTIDEIQKLHIRTVPLHEQPRRIAHQEASRTFGLLTLRYGAEGPAGEDAETGFFRVLDDTSFEPRFTRELDPFEQGCSIASCSFGEGAQQYYVVGTAYAIPEETEPTKGRILVFALVDGKLLEVAQRETKGAVYSLQPFNGKLLAGINSKVQIFRWSEREDGQHELEPECGHHGHILALYMQSRGDFIVVGDLMKSISLLLYKSMDQTIEEIARDYSASWMTAVEVLDDDVFIGAENSFNLFTVRRNAEAPTDEERARLEIVGEYHLGEFVNRFRHGSLVMRLPESESAAAAAAAAAAGPSGAAAGPSQLPTLIYGTVNGVIGVVATLPAEQFAFLQRVQTAMAKAVRGVGGFAHEHWRSFSNERKTVEARGYLDGDLIELFSDIKRPQQEEVAAAVGLSVEELSKRIEELTRTH
eukprot:tig00000851_g4909.t1